MTLPAQITVPGPRSVAFPTYVVIPDSALFSSLNKCLIRLAFPT
jgi:hypothetical protein